MNYTGSPFDGQYPSCRNTTFRLGLDPEEAPPQKKRRLNSVSAAVQLGDQCRHHFFCLTSSSECMRFSMRTKDGLNKK